MKIYRIIQVAENDQIEDRGLVSLIASMNTLEGWTLEQLQYTGTDSERNELHRYVLIFFMEVSRSESAKYISKELLNQPMSDFNSWEEFYESIYINKSGWFEFYENSTNQNIALSNYFTVQLWFSGNTNFNLTAQFTNIKLMLARWCFYLILYPRTTAWVAYPILWR